VKRVKYPMDLIHLFILGIPISSSVSLSFACLGRV